MCITTVIKFRPQRKRGWRMFSFVSCVVKASGGSETKGFTGECLVLDGSVCRSAGGAFPDGNDGNSSVEGDLGIHWWAIVVGACGLHEDSLVVFEVEENTFVAVLDCAARSCPFRIVIIS